MNPLIPRALQVLLIFVVTTCYSQTAIVKRSSNLRASASTSSKALQEIPANTRLTLTSKAPRANYYPVVTPDGKNGWVFAKNVTVSFDLNCTLPFDAIKQSHPNIDEQCSIDGKASKGGVPKQSKLAENHAKNNFCAPGPPIDITYDDLIKLQKQKITSSDISSEAGRSAALANFDINGRSLGEGKVVRIVMYLDRKSVV